MWDQCAAATPFQHPDWMIPWIRHLYGGGRLWSLALRCHGRLAGLMPLFIYGYGGTPEVRRLVFVGSGITDYLDLLIRPEYTRPGTAELLRHIAANRAEWDYGDLQEIREGSPLLESDPVDSVAVDAQPCSICPVLALSGNVEEFETRLPDKLRVDQRRAHNRLDRAGARFETGGPGTLDQFLDALFELHTARWQERHESGVLSAEKLREFHRETAACFARSGLLRLYGLRLEGRLCAVLYAFAARGCTYAYLSGFDPALAKMSPGTALVRYAMEEAIREGMHQFDFLRKPEPFKHLWGAQDCVNYRVLLAPSRS